MNKPTNLRSIEKDEPTSEPGLKPRPRFDPDMVKLVALADVESKLRSHVASAANENVIALKNELIAHLDPRMSELEKSVATIHGELRQLREEMVHRLDLIAPNKHRGAEVSDATHTATAVEERRALLDERPLVDDRKAPSSMPSRKYSHEVQEPKPVSHRVQAVLHREYSWYTLGALGLAGILCLVALPTAMGIMTSWKSKDDSAGTPAVASHPISSVTPTPQPAIEKATESPPPASTKTVTTTPPPAPHVPENPPASSANPTTSQGPPQPISAPTNLNNWKAPKAPTAAEMKRCQEMSYDKSCDWVYTFMDAEDKRKLQKEISQVSAPDHKNNESARDTAHKTTPAPNHSADKGTTSGETAPSSNVEHAQPTRNNQTNEKSGAGFIREPPF